MQDRHLNSEAYFQEQNYTAELLPGSSMVPRADALMPSKAVHTLNHGPVRKGSETGYPCINAYLTVRRVPANLWQKDPPALDLESLGKTYTF